jgi:hypothetical protein
VVGIMVALAVGIAPLGIVVPAEHGGAKHDPAGQKTHNVGRKHGG